LLEDYLEEIALITDVDDYNSSENTVSLMTIHSAKGLEFNCVFLPGMEENIFPSSLNGENDDEIAEERRLAYVALTRARKKVFILHTSSRLLYGKTSFNNISRFVTEIPPENLDSPIKQRRNSFMFKDEQNYSNSNVFNNKSKELFNNTKSNVQPHLSFKVGDRVKHIIFGDGIITEAKDVGGDVLYVIAFDKVGNKKLMGSYAKLQKNDM